MSRPQYDEPAHWRRRGRAAKLAVGTIGGVGADPAAGPATSPGNGRGHRARPRPLTYRERELVRQRSLAGLVRPHRYPWQPPELDLADLPCVCNAEAACALHLHELGGPRPYAR
jgi:hypothetical protein